MEEMTPPVEGDLLMGASAIAAHLGITRRQAYRLVYTNLIPTFKLGGTVCAKRSTLNRWLEEKDRLIYDRR